MKKTKLISKSLRKQTNQAFLFLTLIFAHITYANENALTGIRILNSFQLCSIPSSYGPKCKALPAELISSFTPSQIEDIQTIIADSKSLNLETENWVYSFTIRTQGEHMTTVRFEDYAKIGTYHTVSLLYFEWDENLSNWKLSKIENTHITH